MSVVGAKVPFENLTLQDVGASSVGTEDMGLSVLE